MLCQEEDFRFVKSALFLYAERSRRRKVVLPDRKLDDFRHLEEWREYWSPIKVYAFVVLFFDI